MKFIQYRVRKGKPKSGSWLVDYLVDRVKKSNKNFVAIFVGNPGSGKSYSALKLAEIISEQFNRKFNVNNIVFRARDFINLIGSGKLKKGEVVIFDEAGTGEAMSSRNWYSIQNKLVDSTVQTFRFKNLFVFFTTPLDTFVDSHARKLFNARFFVKGVIKKEKKTLVKPYFLIKDVLSDNVRNTFLRVYIKRKGEDAVIKKISQVKFGLPSPELILAYEEKKQFFLNKYYKEMGEILERVEIADKNKYLIKDLKSEGLRDDEISIFLSNNKEELLKKE